MRGGDYIMPGIFGGIHQEKAVLVNHREPEKHRSAEAPVIGMYTSRQHSCTNKYKGMPNCYVLDTYARIESKSPFISNAPCHHYLNI